MIVSCLAVLSFFTRSSVDTRRIDAILKSYVHDRHFSGSVLIAREGQILFEKSYGMANWDFRSPNTRETKFRLGSVTKQFTAAAVLLLAEQGKLKLDDLILKYFPSGPESWKAITIRHLLHHESGIPDIADMKDFPEFKRKRHTEEQIRARFDGLPLLFEPGTKHRYSNSGYILLGQLISKVSGESYDSFLRKSIFSVAGMANSGQDSSTSVLPNRATGYTATKEGFDVAGYVDMSVPGGAGSLYSTTEDLLRWETALFGGKILGRDSLATMVAPLAGVKPSSTGIGMGLAIDDLYGRQEIYFQGGIEGFNSLLAYDPMDHTVVVALSNVNSNLIEAMCGQISAVSRGENVVLNSERHEIKLDEEAIKKFLGKYKVSPNVNLTIGFEAGSLYVQVDRQSRFKLFPEAPTRFFLRDFDAQAEFISDGHGAWKIKWRQNGTTSIMEPGDR